MKYFTISLIIILIPLWFYGQTVKLQGGISVSGLDWRLEGIPHEPILSERLPAFYVMGGLDYLQKKHFSLSSNLGMMARGGKGSAALIDENGVPIGETVVVKAKLNYLMLNSTFDLKYPVKDIITPFISVGPRVDYLITHSKEFDGLDDLGELEKWSYGFLLGGGLRYFISDIVIGIRSDYYIILNDIADWEIAETNVDGKVSGHAFTVGLSVGYVLNRSKGD